jgi:enamine deaminase RidA (YjgF/YER057c/UK114 family)
MNAEQRLRDLNITLPDIMKPAGNYQHAMRSGNLVYLAGKPSTQFTGKVGASVSQAQAYEAAQQVGLALLAVLRQEIGTLDKVQQVVKVQGLVNATPEFSNHPSVIDGCSDLFVSIFGERGRHARTSMGVASLPHQTAVEIDAVFEVTG